MLQKILWASGSIGAHAVLVTAAFMPPATNRAGVATQPLSVQLLSAADQRAVSSTSTTQFAGVAAPAAAEPMMLLTPTVLPSPPVPATLAAYLPSSVMERRPTPISEPDMSGLAIGAATGARVRLRLYIDRLGKVVNVVTLVAADGDVDFAAALANMFRATAFLPGQRAGVDVPSYMEIELAAN